MSTTPSSSSPSACRGSEIGRPVTIRELVRADPSHGLAGHPFVCDLHGVDLLTVVGDSASERHRIVFCPECPLSEPEPRSDLAHSLVHALRGPIRQLVGLSQLLRQPGLSAEAVARFNGHLEGAGVRAGHLLDRFVSLADLEHREIHDEPIDLTGFAHEGVCVRVEGPSFVHADRAAMEVLFHELFDNSRAAGAQVVEVDTQLTGGRLVVRVSDDGGGLLPGVVPQLLLRPFHSLSNQSGLGLNLVNTVCRRYGSQLAVDSRGGALVFSFDLPAREADPVG